jgi:hypothetical protein
MQRQAHARLLHRLDAENYSKHELVVITLPLTLPYPVYQQDYERVDGEFEYKGEFYKLVKQKLENDTLFLVCIKDREAKKIASVLSDFSKMSNDLPGSKQAQNFLGKLHKDYNTSEFIQFYKARFMYERTYIAASREYMLLDATYPVPSPPPKL